MVTPTQVELDYLANVTGPTQTVLNAAIAAVSIDQGVIDALGMSLISDTTSNIGVTQVQRAIVLSLVQPDFISVANPPPVVPWTGSVVSTSPHDSAAGTGVRTITVHYNDPSGGPHTEVVTLNGTTPVKMANTNKAVITSVVFTTVGSFNGNVGMITFFADSEELTPHELIQAPVVGTVGENFTFYFPVVQTDQKAPLRNLFTAVLQEGAGTPIIASDPILS